MPAPPSPTTFSPPAAGPRTVPLEPASRWRQFVGVVAVLAGIAYLVWRVGWTLHPGNLWLSLPMLAVETLSVVLAGTLLITCWRLTDRPVLPVPEDLSVAVLIATFNEPREVLTPTILGALAMRHHEPFEVVVCDDGGRDWVRSLCEELGATYRTRSGPRLHAKAGNLNNGIALTHADVLVTLDADFVPRPELLELTLGEFSDPRVAVVQGPQIYYNRGFQHPSRFTDPTYSDQSVFYETIQRGKDRHNASFWCGCPAVLRRDALMSVGGIATNTITEDCETTIAMHRLGWRTAYRSERMAVGLAPEEIGAYMVQRGRWAQGTWQLLRRCNPLTGRGLTLMQRIHYLVGPLYYLTGPLRLVSLIIPGAVLATGVLPIPGRSWTFAAVFLPQYVLLPLAALLLTRMPFRPLEGEMLSIATCWAFTKSMVGLVAPGRGGFKVTPKGARDDAKPLRFLRVQLGVAVLLAVALTYQVVLQQRGAPEALQGPAYALSSFWALMNITMIGLTARRAVVTRHRRRGHRFPVSLDATVDGAHVSTPLTPAKVFDLNQFGLLMSVASSPASGSRVRMVLLLDDGPVEVTGTVASAVHDHGAFRVGVRFDGLEDSTQDAIVMWCLRHPFGPDAQVGMLPPTDVAAPTPVVRERVA